MSIYLPFTEDNFLEHVDLVTKKWGQCTAPIYIEQISASGRSTGAVDLVGSSFFAVRKGKYFLVTAAHVFDGQDLKRVFTLNINGKGVLLNGLPFARCFEDDIAVAPLPEAWLSGVGIDRLMAISLDDVETPQYEPFGLWVSIGYPNSKNGLNPRLNQTVIYTHGTSFTERIEKPTAKSHIKNPVGFRFDKKHAIDTAMKSVNPPSFSGTSGGPVLEVLADVAIDGSFKWTCRLEGVFIGWHKREKEALAARVPPLKALIDGVISRLETVSPNQA